MSITYSIFPRCQSDATPTLREGLLTVLGAGFKSLPGETLVGPISFSILSLKQPRVSRVLSLVPAFEIKSSGPCPPTLQRDVTLVRLGYNSVRATNNSAIRTPRTGLRPHGRLIQFVFRDSRSTGGLESR